MNFVKKYRSYQLYRVSILVFSCLNFLQAQKVYKNEN